MTRVDVLDHGYVELVEPWGSDQRIIEAARMSTDKGFVGWGASDAPGDERLLKYLWVNKHYTPFEMAGAIVEVQAPIFVFREFMRHRTFSFNELSGRYTAIPNVNYIPTVDRLLLGSDGKNKQAGTVKGAEVLTSETAAWYITDLTHQYFLAEGLYQEALGAGVPKELARIHLPVGRYSRMRASANLRNWLAFITLRSADNAQWEIRQYSDSVKELLESHFPQTMKLFNEYGA